MPSDFDDNLLREGILRYKAEEYPAARRFLERALDNSDDVATRARAHYYLSLLSDDPAEKRRHLEETLADDMSHAEARRDLAILDGKLKPEQIVDPDALRPASTDPSAAQADRFTCPKCGGRMVYAPDGMALVCEYCQRSQGLRRGAVAADQDFFLAMAVGKGHRTPVATQVCHCQGCGAEFLLSAQEMSAACAHCGSLHIVRMSRELAAPDSILPFGLDAAQAGRRLAEWLERKGVALEQEAAAPRALYLPVWSFDVGGQIPWKGVVYRKDKPVPVSGTEGLQFANLAVPSSPRAAQLLEEALPSFDLTILAPYDPRFLAGWPAEVYEISMSDASLEARRQAVEGVRRSIRAQHGRLDQLSYSASAVQVESFQLVLLPVWYADCRAAGGDFRVVINGASGAAFGQAPGRGLRGWLSDLFSGEG